jgi:hypothetical protein
LITVGLTLIAVTAASSSAQTNAWNGTWKLNVAKSQLNGPTFIIKVTGKAEFGISTRSFNYKLLCDGKFRTVVGNRSLACLNATATTMDTAEKENGKLLNTVHRELSADNRILTQTMVAFDEHGSPKNLSKNLRSVLKIHWPCRGVE